MIRFKLAAAADWTNPKGLMEICTPQAGSALPSTLVMNAGKVTGTTLCTGVYQYTVGLADDRVSTGYLTRK